jgi:hypothetical protein
MEQTSERWGAGKFSSSRQGSSGPTPWYYGHIWGTNMSHFTKCDLKLTNLAAIKKALADMAVEYAEGTESQTVTVRGYRGDTLQAALSVNMGRWLCR